VTFVDKRIFGECSLEVTTGDADASTTLLLACLKAEPEAGLDSRLARLTAEEWAGLITTACRHGVAPILYMRLKRPPLKTVVPASILNRVRDTFLGSAALNVRRYHQLAQLLKIFQEAGIPAIALKGTHLGEVVYASRGVRTMSDVDLLVREGDLARIEATLLALGYRPREQHREVAQDNKHFGYLSRDGRLCLEIHWHIMPGNSPFKVDVEGLWQRSQPTTIVGVPARVLSPSDLLLHLSLHLFDHWFNMGLKPYCDIAAVIQHYGPGVNWEEVEQHAREWGMGKVTYLALRLSGELLAAAVPAEVLRALQPGDCDPALLAFAREQAWRGGSSAPDLPPTRLALLWGARPLREKVAILWASAFPSRAVLARLYPVPSDSLRVYLYYPVYIKDQFRRTRRALWRLLRRDKAALATAGHKNRSAALIDWLMT